MDIKRLKQLIKRSVIGCLIFSIMLFLFLYLYTKIGVCKTLKECPNISFLYNGININNTVGFSYKKSNAYNSCENVIPIFNNKINLKINNKKSNICKLKYILTNKNNKKLESNIIKVYKNNIQLKLKKKVKSKALMHICLFTNNSEQIHYYAKLINVKKNNLYKCLNFANSFSKSTINDKNFSKFKKHMEVIFNDLLDFTPQKVNINSSFDNVTWNYLNPTKISNSQIYIRNIENNKITFKIFYNIKLKIGSKYQQYKVEEDIVVAAKHNKTALLKYNRFLIRNITEKDKLFDINGLCLGITDKNINYKISKNNKYICFEMNKSLYLYDVKNKKVSKIYSCIKNNDIDSFENIENSKIKIIKILNNGNVFYSVFGYKNFGKYKGNTMYEHFLYNKKNNKNENKAKLIIDLFPKKAINLFDKYSFFNINYNQLYIYMHNKIYKISFFDDKLKKIFFDKNKNIKNKILFNISIVKDDLYKYYLIFSHNKKMASYYDNKDKIMVFNFYKDCINNIKLKNKNIKIIGFFEDNLVYVVLDNERIKINNKYYQTYKKIIIFNFKKDKIKEIKSKNENKIIDVKLVNNCLIFSKTNKKNSKIIKEEEYIRENNKKFNFIKIKQIDFITLKKIIYIGK